MSDLVNVRARYNQMASTAAAARTQLETGQGQLEAIKAQGAIITWATDLVRQLMKEAQAEFKDQVDESVTLAVRSLFDESFRFDLEITTGKTLLCRPVIWETYQDGTEVEYVPKDEMGGSVIDPIGLALRVVLQQCDPEPTRATLWLDEPMKNVGKGELLLRAGRLIADVGAMGIQVILITHEPELAEIADRAWTVVRRNGRSIVTLGAQYRDGVVKGPQKRKLIE